MNNAYRLLVLCIEKCSCNDEVTKKLYEFANSVKNKLTGMDHSLKDIYSLVVEQCNNIGFLSSFVVCFADLVLKLPRNLIYSWLIPLFVSFLFNL